MWGGIALAALTLDGVLLPWSLWKSSPGSRPVDIFSQWFLLHLVGGGVFLWYRYGRPRPATKPGDASGYGSAGTARFAKRDELRQYLKADGPGLILGKVGNKYLILPPDPTEPHNQNVTVIGGSGTRKTRSFVQPNILQSALHGNESLIVIDPKGVRREAH